MTSHVFWAYPPDYISGPLRLHYWSKGHLSFLMSWTQTSCPPLFSATLPRLHLMLGIGAPHFPHAVDGLPPWSRNLDDILLLSLFSLSSTQILAFQIFFIQCRALLGKTSIPAKKIIMWSQSCLKMFTELFQNFTKLSQSCVQVFLKKSPIFSKWRQNFSTKWSPFRLSCGHEMR